jgi:hypothetical protein
MHVLHEPCCLCHSPTLRPWIDRSSYVEGFWSPALLCRPKKSKLNPKQYFRSFFVPKHGGTFLSQVGPHSRLALSQLSIFLSCGVLSSPETTKATPWVALAWSCYAASFLARAPLREGGSETGPATRDDGVVPARHRGGRGRFGELRCVDGLQHGLHGLSPGRRIDQTADVRKGCNEKSNKLLRNRRSELLLDCTSPRSARGVRSRHGGGRWPRD